MSVSLSASAAGTDDLLAGLENIDLSQIQIPSFEMPEYDSLQALYEDIAKVFAFEPIMKYVYMFHEYMDDFYREFDTFLRAFGVVLNGILVSVF